MHADRTQQLEQALLAVIASATRMGVSSDVLCAEAVGGLAREETHDTDPERFLCLGQGWHGRTQGAGGRHGGQSGHQLLRCHVFVSMCLSFETARRLPGASSRAANSVLTSTMRL